MPTPPSPLYLLLFKIVLSVSLGCSLLWIADYSRTRWWKNSVGLTLVTKTGIIAVLLAVQLVTFFVRLDPEWLDIVRWTDLYLVALVAPIMVWRMIIFKRVSTAIVLCSNGHQVSPAVRYCPMCGVKMQETESSEV